MAASMRLPDALLIADKIVHLSAERLEGDGVPSSHIESPPSFIGCSVDLTESVSTPPQESHWGLTLSTACHPVATGKCIQK
eukprot:987404-Amphidinium_carterae.1